MLISEAYITQELRQMRSSNFDPAWPSYVLVANIEKFCRKNRILREFFEIFLQCFDLNRYFQRNAIPMICKLINVDFEVL